VSLPEANENPELPAGLRLLDRYTILDRVGSGGMASIYRATDERLERVVCVKLLRLVFDGVGSASGHGVYQATYTHFLQEALALSKLQHPNTLRIYDFGYTDDRRPFQISEFLEGGNLDTQVRGTGKLTHAETISVLERICGAVTEAHQHGIIHRDIKPSNILFARIAVSTDSSREVGHALVPKLADFGISSSRVYRAGTPEAEALSTVALFSPRWAAPEQLSSSLEGPATDVYALGLITAYMLSGRVLFADPDVKAHFEERIHGDEFAHGRLVSSGIDDRVQRVLLHAMAANPAGRIPSPSAFFDEIRNVLSRGPRSEPPVSRRSLESITLVAEPSAEHAPEAEPVAPPERSASVGGRGVRIVELSDKLDFTLHAPPTTRDPSAPLRPIRFRISLLPAPGPEGFAIHVKGLNCFIVRAPTSSPNPPRRPRGAPGHQGHRARPTPAITATESGEAELVSGEQDVLTPIAWSFGRASDVGAGAGRVFDFGGGDLVIPFSQASQAVAIDLGPEREGIVICKRA
jgi:serine/threonine protein kinase